MIRDKGDALLFFLDSLEIDAAFCIFRVMYFLSTNNIRIAYNSTTVVAVSSLYY